MSTQSWLNVPNVPNVHVQIGILGGSDGVAAQSAPLGTVDTAQCGPRCAGRFGVHVPALGAGLLSRRHDLCPPCLSWMRALPRRAWLCLCLCLCCGVAHLMPALFLVLRLDLWLCACEYICTWASACLLCEHWCAAGQTVRLAPVRGGSCLVCRTGAESLMPVCMESEGDLTVMNQCFKTQTKLLVKLVVVQHHAPTFAALQDLVIALVGLLCARLKEAADECVLTVVVATQVRAGLRAGTGWRWHTGQQPPDSTGGVGAQGQSPGRLPYPQPPTTTL